MSTNLLPPRPNAIATMMTSDDFLPGAQTVLYSVKNTMADPPHKSCYPPEFIVLVTKNVSKRTREGLQPFCSRIVEVDAIPLPSTKSHVPGWADTGYTKLNLWKQTEYNKILYLDADCLAVKDVGHLLYRSKEEEEQGWNGLAASPDVYPPDHFNAGVLLLKPHLPTYQTMLTQIPTLPTYDGGDTGFLNAFFPTWHTLPSTSRLHFGYNAQRSMHHATFQKRPEYWQQLQESRLKIVHFSSTPKPWECSKETTRGVLELLWWKEFEASGRFAAAGEGVAKAAPAAPTAAAAAPRSAKQVHDLVSKRYKSYRKQGMDAKTAMKKARIECGAAEEDGHADDPAAQVASMFGLR